MYLKQSLLIIAIVSINAIASEQLDFLKDTIDFVPQDPLDELVIRNISQSAITIDTLQFFWEVNGKQQPEAIGMQFDTLDPATGKRRFCAMYEAPLAIEEPDGSFSFSTKLIDQQMVIRPHTTLTLTDFYFGRCIGCAGILDKTFFGHEDVSIVITFINDEAGRDTVVFIGEVWALVTTGVKQVDAEYFREPKTEPLGRSAFLASGRKVTIPWQMNDKKNYPFNVYFNKSKRGQIPVNGISK